MAPQTGWILIKITLPFLFALPPSLRGLPRSWHRPKRERQRWMNERKEEQAKRIKWQKEGMNKVNQPVTLPLSLSPFPSPSFPTRVSTFPPFSLPVVSFSETKTEGEEGWRGRGEASGWKWGERVRGVVWLPLGNLNESRGYPLNAKIRSRKISFFHPD